MKLWQFGVQCRREGSQQLPAGLMWDQGGWRVGGDVGGVAGFTNGLQHQFDSVHEDGFAVHAHDAAVLCLSAERDGAGLFFAEQWCWLQQMGRWNRGVSSSEPCDGAAAVFSNDGGRGCSSDNSAERAVCCAVPEFGGFDIEQQDAAVCG